jgi:hypothetical protein
MKISTKDGIFGDWYDYEIILPTDFIIFKDTFGYEGFGFAVKADDGYNYALRIIEANLLQVKYKDQIYDMRKPKEYLTLKSILEADIVLASLD